MLRGTNPNMQRSIHPVAGLSDASRSGVESLVGHSLQNDEMVYVATLGIQKEPAPAQRETAWDELESIIAETQQSAAKSGLSGEQIDNLIDAECAAVRYAYKNHSSPANAVKPGENTDVTPPGVTAGPRRRRSRCSR